MNRLTDLEIERFLVDDLDDADRARVAAAIDTDADLRAHVAARRDEQRVFLATARPLPALRSTLSPSGEGEATTARPHPSLRSTLSPSGEGEAVSSSRAKTSWWASLQASWMPLAAACAVVAVFFVVEGNGADDNDGVRVRGDGLVARLLVRRGDVVFAFAGEPLRAGDAVRVEVALARAARCSVVGVDVHGQRVLHYDAVAVARGTQVLPDSLVLDDSVGAEALVVACANDANELAGVELIEPAQLAARHPRARIAKLMFTKEPPAR